MSLDAADEASPASTRDDDFLNDVGGDDKADRKSPDEKNLHRRHRHNKTERSERGGTLNSRAENLLTPLIPPGTANSSSGEVEHQDLNIPEDSFSMFYVANQGRDHLFPLVIYGLQMGILVLMLVNLLQRKDSPLELRMNIPVRVSDLVTVAQYLAIFVSMITSSDFVDGILFFRTKIICDKDNGANSTISESGSEADRVNFAGSINPMHVTKYFQNQKWEISNLMRMSEGALVMGVSFVFIAQSDTVIDLLLNFAAVTFVSELDDVAFRLSRNGFLGTRSQHIALLVQKHKVDMGGKRYTQKAIVRRNAIRFMFFSAIIIIMWIVFSIIVVMDQKYMVHACKSVTLTVGESRNQWLRMFSGTYTIAEKPHAWRAVYVQDQGRDEQGWGVYIGYCDKWGMNRWTVTHYWWAIQAEKDNCSDPRDPCCYFDLQSERTSTYDITEVRGFHHYSGDDVESDIRCNDCIIPKVKTDNDESCGWEGTCELKLSEGHKTRTCNCSEKSFGDSCQFQGPCTELIFQDDEFPGYGKSFHLLYENGNEGKKPVMVHDRPAYITRNPSSPEDFAVMLFDGGRWAVIDSDNFYEWDPSSGKTIEEYLMNFNALRESEHKRFSYTYISEHTNGGSPENIPFRDLLSGQETDTSVLKFGDVEFILLCADCQTVEDRESSSVSRFSMCQGREGSGNRALCQPQYSSYHEKNVTRCICEDGFIGPLCHTRPVEGKLSLYLEHGKQKSCSVCGENNMRTVRDLVGLHGNTCLPFPREPLFFEGGNGTAISRQLGLNLNKTHFSVFVSDKGQFFPKKDNHDADELICSVQEGSIEMFSMKRSASRLKEQTNIDLAVLLDENKDFFGKTVDPANIDCFTKSNIDEHECDGSKEHNIRKIYDPTMTKSHLIRAWIQLNLKVTQ